MWPEHSGAGRGTGLVDSNSARHRPSWDQRDRSSSSRHHHTPTQGALTSEPRRSMRGLWATQLGGHQSMLPVHGAHQKGGSAKAKGTESSPGFLCVLMGSGGAGVRLDSQGGIGRTQHRGRRQGPGSGASQCSLCSSFPGWALLWG